MSLKNPPAGTEDPQPLLVDERTGAAMLGVAPRTLWSMAESGELPCVRIGRRKLYSIETLRQFIADRESASLAKLSKIAPQETRKAGSGANPPAIRFGERTDGF